MRKTGMAMGPWLVAVLLGCHGARSGTGAWEVWPDSGHEEPGPGTDREAGPQDGREAGPKEGTEATSWGHPDFGPGGSGSIGKALVELKPAESCEEVLAAWKDAAVEEMRKRLEAAWYAVTHWRKPCYPEPWLQDAAVVMDMAAAGDTGGGAQEYSTTNVQVVGVDEADWLKNDGQWIQVLADGKLQIIAAWPPEQTHIVSKTPIPGRPIAMFVHQDVAVVFASVGGGYDGYYKYCTYGYDCEFTGDGADTAITVWDLHDRAKPIRMREVHISGSYLTSRRIEDIVYAVIHFREPEVLPPGLIEVYPKVVLDAMDAAACGEPLPLDPEVAKEAFEDLFEQNKAKILASDTSAWIPTVTDTVYHDGKPFKQSNPLTDCEGYLLDQVGDGMALLSLVSFDMTRKDRLEATTIRSRPGAVFASKQALYLAMRHQKVYGQPWYEDMAG